MAHEQIQHLKQRFGDDPVVLVYLDKVEVALGLHGELTPACREMLADDAAQMRLADQKLAEVLAALGDAVPGHTAAEPQAADAVRKNDGPSSDDIAGLMDFLDLSDGPQATATCPQPAVTRRLRGFLDRAAAILAEHHGINARSQVLLNGLADEFGFDAEEKRRAFDLLKGGEPELVSNEKKSASAIPLRKQFNQYVRRELSALGDGTLTGAMHYRLLRAGDEEYGVDAAYARRRIAAICDELGLQVISQQEAAFEIESLASDNLDVSDSLTAADMSELHARGAELGLTGQQVDSIVDDLTHSAQRVERRRHGWQKLGFGVAAALLFLIGLAVFALAIKPAPPLPQVKIPAAPHLAPHPWWDLELRLAVKDLRPVKPQLGRQLADIQQSTGADSRVADYGRLVGQSASMFGSPDSRQQIQPVLVGLLALDPDYDSAAALLDALVDRIPSAGDAATGLSVDRFTNAPWIITTLIDSRSHPAMSDQRRAAVMAKLNERLGGRLNTNLDRETLQQEACNQLVKQQFQLLVNNVNRAPDEVRGLMDTAVAAHLDLSTLGANDLQSFKNAIVLNYLNQPSGDMEAWKPLIRQVLKTGDERLVEQVAERYHRSRPAMKDLLRGLLVELAGAIPEPAIDHNERGQFFTSQAKAYLQHPPTPPEKTDPFFHDLLQAVYWQTLGIALSQKAGGELQFDELRDAGAPTIAAARPAVGGDDDNITTLHELVDQFGREFFPSLKAGKVNESSTLRHLEKITDFAPLVPRIGRADAMALAMYFVCDKGSRLNADAMKRAPRFARWDLFKLALSDALRVSDMSHDKVASLVGNVARHDALPDEGEHWYQPLRVALIRSVLKTQGGDDDRGFVDEAAAELARLYTQQGALRNLFPALVQGNELPGEVALRQVRGLAPGAGRFAVAPDDMAFVARLPREMEVVDYLAENDLQATVMLRKMSLRLLAIELQRRQAAKAVDAKRIVAETLTGDASADGLNALAELLWVERQLLKLWLLWNRDDA